METVSSSRAHEVRQSTVSERQFNFTADDFRQVRTMIHERAGISLGEHKREMVYSRLSRRLRALGRSEFRSYLAELKANPESSEWEAFTNALTTNLTAFFREPHHFPILADYARQQGRPLSIWCCAASTGEEPYSIAMTLLEAQGAKGGESHIIATDIDTDVIARAQSGVYPFERVNKVSPERLRKFFLKGRGRHAGKVRVRRELSDMVTFGALNLLEDPWPLQGGFDVIFCRNIMIYFDKPTQKIILGRMAPLIRQGGLLFAGHSENFTYVTRDFRLLGQTVYERI